MLLERRHGCAHAAARGTARVAAGRLRPVEAARLGPGRSPSPACWSCTGGRARWPRSSPSRPGRATCSLYTPLKTRTSLSTIVGALPGALPPVIGWAAARGQIEPGAFVLFAILFLWQIPHFLAIAWIYREDYARGGLPMLPVLDPDGRITGRQAVANTPRRCSS